MHALTFAAVVHGVDARIIEGKASPECSFSQFFLILHLRKRNETNTHVVSPRMSQIATTSENFAHEK